MKRALTGEKYVSDEFKSKTGRVSVARGQHFH
jgi:hypothetical protein